MSDNRYIVSGVGEFHEIYDTVYGETVFATEDKSKLVLALKQLNIYGELDIRIKEVE